MKKRNLAVKRSRCGLSSVQGMKGLGREKGSAMARHTEEEVVALAAAVVELGNLAMTFGRIDRTCVVHPTGEPESDTDHTVMLAWVAPPLAEIINQRAGYERYPVGRVTQFAVVHDAVEVYAGDTPTHRITAAELAAKTDREYDASVRLYSQFIQRLPWFARMVRRYEEQQEPSARFVRSVDKIVPKIVHVINGAQDLRNANMTDKDFLELLHRQREQIQSWCPEPLLLDLYDVLCNQVLKFYHDTKTGQHVFKVDELGMGVVHPLSCDSPVTSCGYTHAFKKFLMAAPMVEIQGFTPGEYPIELSDDGRLVFVGKQD